MDPVRLVELGGILGDIFGVEVVVGSGDQGFVIDSWLLVWLFAGEWVAGGFLLVDVAVLLLLGRTDLFVVFLELLGGGEAGEEREIGSHGF